MRQERKEGREEGRSSEVDDGAPLATHVRDSGEIKSATDLSTALGERVVEHKYHGSCTTVSLFYDVRIYHINKGKSLEYRKKLETLQFSV